MNAPDRERWYWSRNLIEPNARGASEIRRVWWETLESHTVGFRGSPAYSRWRALLHHFYDPFPKVEHYVSAVPSLTCDRPGTGSN